MQPEASTAAAATASGLSTLPEAVGPDIKHQPPSWPLYRGMFNSIIYSDTIVPHFGHMINYEGSNSVQILLECSHFYPQLYYTQWYSAESESFKDTTHSSHLLVPSHRNK